LNAFYWLVNEGCEFIRGLFLFSPFNTRKMLQRPRSTEYNSYYQNYVALTPDDIMSFLSQQKLDYNKMLDRIEDPDYSYAPGKWSFKQLLIHINDTERIFAYRALRVSRKEKINLPGFDQDAYINDIDYSHLSLDQVATEFDSIRSSSINLFKGFSDAQWIEAGMMSDSAVTVRALPYIIGGHLAHHLNVINERYFN